MKTLLIAITFVLTAITAQADMPDVTLDTPEVVKSPVVVYRLQGVYLGRGPTIKGYYNKMDAESGIVEQVTCTLEDWVETITPAGCSDAQYTNQQDCEDNAETWTPAVTVAHNDLTDKYTAVDTSGMDGKVIIGIIGRAIENTCRGAHYLNYSGTSN